MSRRSKHPANGTLTTIVLHTETYTALRALSRALNFSMREFINLAVERELKRISNQDARA